MIEIDKLNWPDYIDNIEAAGIKNCDNKDKKYKVTNNKDKLAMYISNKQLEVNNIITKMNELLNSINLTAIKRDDGSKSIVNYLDEIEKPFIIKEGKDNAYLKEHVIYVTNDIQKECLLLKYALESKSHIKLFNTINIENLLFNDIMLKLEFIDELIYTRKDPRAVNKSDYLFAYRIKNKSIEATSKMVGYYRQYIDVINAKIKEKVKQLKVEASQYILLQDNIRAIPEYVNIYKHCINIYNFYLNNSIEQTNKFWGCYFEALDKENESLLKQSSNNLDIWYSYILDIINIILDETKILIENINKSNLI